MTMIDERPGTRHAPTHPVAAGTREQTPEIRPTSGRAMTTEQPGDAPAAIGAAANACEQAEPAVSGQELKEAIEYLLAVRDDLFLAGYPVPTPDDPTTEQRIEDVLRHHRAACQQNTDSSGPPTPSPAAPQPTRPCSPSAPDRAAAVSSPAPAPADGAGHAPVAAVAEPLPAHPAAPARVLR
jgi:hypothetical protein